MEPINLGATAVLEPEHLKVGKIIEMNGILVKIVRVDDQSVHTKALNTFEIWKYRGYFANLAWILALLVMTVLATYYFYG